MCHQPHFLPSVQYFKRIYDSDIFIVMDDVQFEKGDWQNRNRILSPHGIQYITVACEKNKKINETRIIYHDKWVKNVIGKLYNAYKNMCGWDFIFDKIIPIIKKKYQFLVDLNMELIYILLDFLNISKKIFFSSELGVYSSSPSKRNADLVHKVKGSKYICGHGAYNYLDISYFSNYGIKVYIHEWQYREYPQKFAKEFVPNLSIIDLIAAMGDRSADYLGSAFLQEFDETKVKFKK